MLLPKASRKRLKEETKTMIFNAENDGTRKKDIDDDCSSGISMRSSQVDLEKELGGLQMHAIANHDRSANHDFSESQDYPTFLSKAKESGKPSEKEVRKSPSKSASAAPKVVAKKAQESSSDEEQPRRKPAPNAAKKNNVSFGRKQSSKTRRRDDDSASESERSEPPSRQQQSSKGRGQARPKSVKSDQRRRRSRSSSETQRSDDSVRWNNPKGAVKKKELPIKRSRTRI